MQTDDYYPLRIIGLNHKNIRIRLGFINATQKLADYLN